jgi:peptide/nickel transport system permease protein
VAALILAIGIGVPLGRFAAKRVRSPADATTTVISLIGVSLPVFVLGMILQFVFAVQLGVLPATGRIDQRLAADLQHITGFLLVDTLLQGRLDLFADASRHLILPAITLASIPLAIITRITRASVLDVSSEDYIRTARAKGLSEGRINQRHLLRNAWLPILTVIGIQVGILLGGAVITETVFAWNGVGRWVVDAIKGKDYFVVQATVLFFALMFLVVNLVVDVLYGVANPQIRYER